MERVKIADILKKFQEGVDFTIESKGKVIFHNKKIVDYLERQGGEKAKWFYDTIRGLIPCITCSYKEKENGNRVFIFKSGNNNKKDNKREIEKNFKENTGIDIAYHGENSNGGHVISRKFKNPKIEEQKNKLIEESMGKKQVDKSEESLVYGASGDIDGTTVFVEKKGKGGFFRESYYQPRSEEEKKQIIERKQKRQEEELKENKKVWEQQIQNKEKSQNDTSPNSDKQERQTEKENNQQNLSQKIDNKDNSSKNIYYGVGVIGLVVLVISAVIVWMKKKK